MSQHADISGKKERSLEELNRRFFTDHGDAIDFNFGKNMEADTAKFEATHWRVVTDFIMAQDSKFERLKNFVNFRTD